MRSRLLPLVLVACSSGSSGGPAAGGRGPDAVAGSPAPAAPGPLVLADADRACTTDAECTSIQTICSVCDGACTGVRVDRAGVYAGRLECTGDESHPKCDYDCRVGFGIEEPRCVEGRCESVVIDAP